MKILGHAFSLLAYPALMSETGAQWGFYLLPQPSVSRMHGQHSRTIQVASEMRKRHWTESWDTKFPYSSYTSMCVFEQATFPLWAIFCSSLKCEFELDARYSSQPWCVQWPCNVAGKQQWKPNQQTQSKHCLLPKVDHVGQASSQFRLGINSVPVGYDMCHSKLFIMAL